jgi:hypothetical protein
MGDSPLVMSSLAHGRMLSDAEIGAVIQQLANGRLVAGRAVLMFPLGEIVGESSIKGFVWAWGIQGMLHYQGTSRHGAEKGAKMIMQGLEPLVSVRDALSTCALAWQQLPEFRRIIFRAEGFGEGPQ